MAEANHGHAPAYGDDLWTARASDAFRALFETDCEVFFAFNGTAANSLALASLCQSYHSVICSAMRRMSRPTNAARRSSSPTARNCWWRRAPDGKLTPDAIRAVATSRSDIHFPKPRVVTITQPTETGQVYDPRRIAGDLGGLPRTGPAACTWTARVLPMPAPAWAAARPT